MCDEMYYVATLRSKSIHTHDRADTTYVLFMCTEHLRRLGLSTFVCKKGLISLRREVAYVPVRAFQSPLPISVLDQKAHRRFGSLRSACEHPTAATSCALKLGHPDLRLTALGRHFAGLLPIAVRRVECETQCRELRRARSASTRSRARPCARCPCPMLAA